MSKIFAIAILALASLPAFAQSDSLKPDHNRIRYYNNLMSGGLIGKTNVGSSLNFATTHGIRYKKISTGVGVGYDAYRDWILLPLYGTISYDFASIKNNKLFVQTSFGHAWARRSNVQLGDASYESDGGRMIQPALGYRIHAQQWSLYLAVGYRFQTINYTRTPSWIWGWPGNFSEQIRQDMERLSFQIGFGLH